MEKFKAPLSFKVIHILNEVVFWLFTWVTFMAIIFAVLILTGLIGKDLQLHVNLPIAFDSQEVGYIVANQTPSNVQIVKAWGDIHFIDTPIEIARLYMIPMIIVIGGIFSLLFVFRKFIRNMRKGIIFEIHNIKLLRILAIGLVIFWMFWRLYDWVSGEILLKRLHFATIDLSSDIQGHNYLVISALILWLLSHIFIRGMELQEDNSLTI